MSVRPATSTLDVPASSLGLERACIGVLTGGRSSERGVSLESGRMIATALTSADDPTDRRGPGRVRPIEILPDGRWRVGRMELTPGAALDALADVDVFFSALHGGEGEGGAIQGLLTCCDRAFTWTGVAGCAASLDKVFARRLLEAAGARVAPAVLVTRRSWRGDPAGVVADLLALGAHGWAIKPREGGSSVGCSIVRSADELPAAFESAFQWEGEALAEALVEGVEATGGVLELPGRGPVALPVVEIRPRAGRFFDFHEKYAEGGALELCPPETLSPSACERVQELALLAHDTLRCAGYSRSDFIVPDGTGEPTFLELNTLPGMTPRSLLPRAAAVAGIDYRTLCLLIAAEGLERAARRRG